MKVKIVNKGIVHCIAVCKNCDWEELGYEIAKKEAIKHVKKYGHDVSIEVGIAYEYKGDEK